MHVIILLYFLYRIAALNCACIHRYAHSTAENMVTAITMYLLLKFNVLLVIIPMASFYQHNIYLSDKLPITNRQQINDTTYHYSSLTEVFHRLSNCCDSTDISIEPGNYNLPLSYVFADLHDIRIRSETKAVIQCEANVNGTYDFDTGIAFLRVTNLVITNISIVGCGMKHVTTNRIGSGKFIFVRSAMFIQNSTDIFLDNLTISESNGIGLLVYDTNGLVTITKSSFINNSLDSLEQSKLLMGGGGIYIEFTECTPGTVLCDSTSNCFNKLTKYTIDQCVFEGNAASYHYNGSAQEHLVNGVLTSFGTGGGLSLWLYGNAENNSFQVTSSFFTYNRALYGGGLYVQNRQNTRNNSIHVSWCHFVANIGKLSGGGLTFGYVINQKGEQSLFNKYTVVNCWFEQNQGKVGGGIAGFGSREPQRIQSTNYFEVCNSSFINNGAQYGSAIQFNKEFFNFIITGSIFTLLINNCTFTDNNLYRINASSNSSSIGAVAMSGVDVEFKGTTTFSNNNSTALIVDGASVKFINDSKTTFKDNSGLHGGAISLISSAVIRVYPNATLTFLRNRAIQYGGAIYVALSAPFDYLFSRTCFIRYYLNDVAPSEWKTNFTFINNTSIVGKNNNTIFANTLRPCIKAYGVGINFFYNNPFHYYLPINDSINTISTSPATFKFVNQTQSSFAVVPGEIINLQVQLIDELGQVVSSTMFIATCNGPPSPYVVPPYHFTNGSIKLAGKPDELCELHMKTDTDYQVSTTTKIVLLNCPPGFVYSNDKKQCECLVNHIRQNPAISGCELTSFQAYFDRFYWIGYESDDTVDLLISPCPYRYCYEDHISQGQLLPRVANKTSLDKFVCGNRNRTGLLCGQCIEGYSVALNSPAFTCYRCKYPQLGTFYLLLSYIIPVSALFYIIMAYNIRMTTGPIGAYLFFSQIISSQYRFVFDYSVKANYDETLAASNIVIAIYSMTNLQFFEHDVFSYCMFSNAGTVDILAFNLILSFYPVFLVFIYFLLRRYCACKMKCYQNIRLSTKSVIHGVNAFLVLCFAKIIILAFGILKSTDISYINGSSFRKVIYHQGNLKYFGDLLHGVYATGSLFTIVTVISIPTLILVFHPIMIGVSRYFEWGETKYVVFINRLLFIHKLKPVLDSFQGDYKDNLSFFAGLHSFLYRLIFFCIVVVVPTPDISGLLVMIIAYFIVILLIHILVMPFKRYIDNASYSLIYTLMLTILIIEHYVYSTGNSTVWLIWLEIILSLLPFICVVIFCLWKLLIAAKVIWRKYYQTDDETHLVS